MEVGVDNTLGSYLSNDTNYDDTLLACVVSHARC
jgi:hypothetical protein